MQSYVCKDVRSFILDKCKVLIGMYVVEGSSELLPSQFIRRPSVRLSVC